MTVPPRRISLLWFGFAIALLGPLLTGLQPARAQNGTPVTMPRNQPLSTGCGDEPAGSVVFVPIDQAGQPVAGVAIADAENGEIAAEIELPAVDRITQLRAPGKALASTTDGAYLIDVETEAATRLDIPAEVGTLFEWAQGLPVGTGAKRTLLSDGIDLFLLDFDDSTVTAVRSLLPAETPDIPLYPVMSPDEEWVLLWDAARLWLMPAAEPTAIRSLTPGGVSLGGSFSQDSRTIIYGRAPASGDDRREIVIEPADGSGSADVVVSGTINGAVFVQGTNLIAFDRILEDDDPIGAELVLLDRIAGRERVLYQHEVQPMSIYPSPNGKRLFVGMNDSELDFRYFDVDLDTRAVTELPEIAGLNAFGPTGGRFKLAMAMNGVTNGNAPNPGYYAVDLDAGAATNLAPITLDSGTNATQPLFDNGGTAAISAQFSPDGQQLWHFDLAAGDATQLTTDSFAGAAISADGCWVAIAAVPAGGNSADAIVGVQPASGGDPVELGPGSNPVWVAG